MRLCRHSAALVLVLLPLAGTAAGAQVVVRADQVVRPVPAAFLGATLSAEARKGTSAADWEPCCLGPAALLPRPVALWRTPGGPLAALFHLNGVYSQNPLTWDGPATGVPLAGFLRAAARVQGGLFHVLNWNATDQELVNLVDYLNGAAPANPPSNWTRTLFRFDATSPPAGYFPWLRGQEGRPEPAAVRYVALGNEVWSLAGEPDARTNHDPTSYGLQAAALIPKLLARDDKLRVGLSIATASQEQNAAYLAPLVYQGLSAARVVPGFVVDHAFFRCGAGTEDGAQAAAWVAWADRLPAVAQANRAELVAAFGTTDGPLVELFLGEFGPQRCAAPSRWEAFGYWTTAAVAHAYAAALQAGFAHASYSEWNTGGPAGGRGMVSGDSPGQVDAAFWGLWFAARLVQGATSVVKVDGVPAGLRAFATRGPGRVRLLVLNTSATATTPFALALEGASTATARALRMDQAYLGGSPFASAKGVTRGQVPQAPPAETPAQLTGLSAPPLSTTLVELDLATAPDGGVGGGDGGADGGTPLPGGGVPGEKASTEGCSGAGVAGGTSVACLIALGMGLTRRRRSATSAPRRN